MKTVRVGLVLAVVSPLAACAASAPLGPGEPDVTALPAEVTVNRSEWLRRCVGHGDDRP